MIGCSPSVRYSASPRPETLNDREKIYREGQTLTGTISYYAQEFHGRKTANGEIFDMYGKTAAHLYLPFNSVLQVTNTSNGKSVIVRVNDRGPFKAGRILDLSYQAAKEIDLIGTGTTRAIIRIISLGSN
jgi:rare lipoprotein A